MMVNTVMAILFSLIVVIGQAKPRSHPNGRPIPVEESVTIETMISRRCYLANTRGSRSHPENFCPIGQWCLPDNFYCYFYVCANSIGWCVKDQDTPKQYDGQQKWYSQIVAGSGKNYTAELLDQEFFGSADVKK